MAIYKRGTELEAALAKAREDLARWATELELARAEVDQLKEDKVSLGTTIDSGKEALTNFAYYNALTGVIQAMHRADPQTNIFVLVGEFS